MGWSTILREHTEIEKPRIDAHLVAWSARVAGVAGALVMTTIGTDGSATFDPNQRIGRGGCAAAGNSASVPAALSRIVT